MDETNSSKRYEPSFIDLSNKNSSHTQVIELAGHNKKILEIGTSTGYITKILKEHGNDVVGIEVDPDAARIAEQYCSRIITGDIEKIDLDNILDPSSFDVIICGDVLEHLVHPLGIVKRIKKFLKNGGYLVVSIPNFCHGDVFFALLNGDFHYTDMGLLDKTHLHFFGLKNIYTLFSEAGYQISNLTPIHAEIGKTEQKIQNKIIPERLRRFIQSLPNTSVYQFVFLAYPRENPKIPPPDDIDFERRLAETLEGEEKNVFEQELRISGLTIKSQNLEAIVAERDKQIGRLKNQAVSIKRENEELKRSITHTITAKFHRKVIERLFPLATRRRRYYNLGLEGGRILTNRGPGSLIASIKQYREDNRTSGPSTGKRKIFSSQSGDSFTIDPSEFLPAGGKKIAVHVHVFYPELFDEIITYLSNIPAEYSLFISVVRDEDRAVILEKARQMQHVNHTDIRVVKNQGRNIAPFLVEFGPVLRNFDYICHIHTKKSLFTGKEKTDWRHYLFDRLLGSTDTVKAVFTAFQKDPLVGIIFPEIYPALPYWACTWLSNKSVAPRILKRLNILFDPDEYFDYPVGSMFWIRKESLEPLLDLNLTINDFPPESGQTDGTLQHTLERCFVLAGQSRGFRYLVIQNPSRPLFTRRSSRNLHQYTAVSFNDRFRKSTEGVTIVSFDIFDTLLIRPFASPPMVLSFLDEIVQRDFGITGFRNLRVKAEAIVRERKNNSGDARISEIYSVFSEMAKVDTDTAGKLLNLEVSTEKILLIPQNDVIESARYAKEQGKRLILVSDTYFEKRDIDDILQSKGISFFDAIYLSSETGKRKDRDDLWEYVIECEGITPENFLHVGDNEQSDIQKLVDRGFKKYIHRMRPTALFRQSDLGTYLWDTMKPSAGWRENLLYGKIANRFCTNPDVKSLLQSGMVLEEPQVFGYVVFGPIIFNFMNWLIRTSREDRCRQLWFTTREGYLLDAIFNLIVSHPDLADLKKTLPEHRYFLCSRRTAVFASLQKEDDIRRLIEGRYHGLFRDFLSKRLLVSSLSRIEERLGTEILEKPVRLPEDNDRVSEYLNRVLDILEVDARKERDAFAGYCHLQGFTPSKRTAVVDMGYSATIQSALIGILNHPIDGYYFITESRASRILSSGSVCRAYFDEFVHPSKKKEPIHRYSLLLEAVLTAPTGQVIRFERDASAGISPVFKEGGVSQKEFARISRIHEGILSFVSDMLDEFGPGALQIEFPKDLVQVCYERVIDEDIGLGTLKPALSVEDDYCGNNEISPVEFYRKRGKK